MPYSSIRLFLLFSIGLLVAGCVHTGDYRLSGAFVNVQLPASGKQIGILDPRGPYSNAEAKRVMHRTLLKTLGQCPNTQVLTEDGLNDRGELPPIYGDQLTADNLAWFAENTTMDYLILLDVGPGKVIGDPAPPKILPADQEVSAILTVFDLNHGGIFKEVVVNGTMDYDYNPTLFATAATMPRMGTIALKRALVKLERLSDCR